MGKRAQVIAIDLGASGGKCFSGLFDDNGFSLREIHRFSHEPTTPCNTLFPSWAAPRLVAGGPLSANIPKCSLKPIDMGDYTVEFTRAEKARLRSIFPNGVCDWSRNGNHTGVVPYGSYGPSKVNFIGN